MLAGLAVTAAEPSGLVGAVKEAWVSGKALVAARTDADAGDLLKGVVADFETPEGRAATRDRLKARFEGLTPAEISQRSIEALAEVGAIIDARAPGESTAFEHWLHDISRKVAEASREGGFLGFGGVGVSEAEKATVDQVAKALRLSA